MKQINRYTKTSTLSTTLYTFEIGAVGFAVFNFAFKYFSGMSAPSLKEMLANFHCFVADECSKAFLNNISLLFASKSLGAEAPLAVQ